MKKLAQPRVLRLRQCGQLGATADGDGIYNPLRRERGRCRSGHSQSSAARKAARARQCRSTSARVSGIILLVPAKTFAACTGLQGIAIGTRPRGIGPLGETAVDRVLALLDRVQTVLDVLIPQQHVRFVIAHIPDPTRHCLNARPFRRSRPAVARDDLEGAVVRSND